MGLTVNTPHQEQGSGPLWRNCDFMVLRAGQTVSIVGSGVSGLAFPLLVLALTHSTAQAGIVSFCGIVPGVLLALPAGALVDRWNRKRVMILCDAGRALALGSVALALAFGRLSVVLLSVVALAESSLAVFFGLAESAAVPRVVPKEQLTEAVSVNQATGEGASLIGPSLSGVLYSLGQLLPFVVDSISYGISVLSLIFIKTEFQEERPPTTRDLRSEVLEGLHWAWSQPFIRVSAFLIAGLNFLAAATTLTVIVLAKHLNASPATIGLIFALFSAGGLLGSITAPWVRRRLGFSEVLVGVMWGFAVLWPLYALAPNALLLGLIGAAMGTTGATWNVIALSYLLGVIPDALQGRVRGAIQLFSRSAAPLGAIASGILLQTIGPVATVLAFSLVALALAMTATLNGSVRNAPPLTQT